MAHRRGGHPCASSRTQTLRRMPRCSPQWRCGIALPRGAQPGHDRRQPRPRRPGRGLAALRSRRSAHARVFAAPPARASITVEGIMHGAFTTALAEDEIIESIDVPKLSPARAGATTSSAARRRFCRGERGCAPRSAAAPRGSSLGALDGPPIAARQAGRDVRRTGAPPSTRSRCRAALTRVAPGLDPAERADAPRRSSCDALDQALGS